MDFKLSVIFLVLVAFSSIALAYDKEKCDAPPSETGLCAGATPAWVYKDRKCQFLRYGGCGATKNIFIFFKSHCEAACLN